MPDESPAVAEELKSLRAEVIRLSGRCDAFFAALGVLSIQGTISVDQLNNLMKIVPEIQAHRNLSRIADTNQRLATDLKDRILPLPPQKPSPDSHDP